MIFASGILPPKGAGVRGSWGARERGGRSAWETGEPGGAAALVPTLPFSSPCSAWGRKRSTPPLRALPSSASRRRAGVGGLLVPPHQARALVDQTHSASPRRGEAAARLYDRDDVLGEGVSSKLLYNHLMATKGAWWKAALWGWVVVVLVGGCIAGDQVSEIVTPSPNIPTNTVAPIVRPSITPVPTLTPLTPSLTPLPTLPLDEAEALVLELLETNGGCELPCWWGITPGGTTWQEAFNFLNTLATQTDWRETRYPQLEINQYGALSYYINVPEYINPNQRMRQIYTVEEHLIVSIRVEATISLNELLSKYGMPQEIWIQTFPFQSYGKLEMFAGFYYPDYQILAIYYDQKAVYSRTGYILGCFDELHSEFNNPTLELWSSGVEISRDKVQPFNNQDYQVSFEDATGLSIADFYESGKPCIETPAEIWQ